MVEIEISKIIFRGDLYPRIERSPQTVQKYAEDLDLLPPIEINQHSEIIDGWHQWTAHEVEVSYGFIFSEICPPSLRSLLAGVVSEVYRIPPAKRMV